MDDVPVSTQWLIDATSTVEHDAIYSVFMVRCNRTRRKGTGFSIAVGSKQFIVTNEHVVNGCAAEEIIAFSALNEEINFSNIMVDQVRDLAVLAPTRPLPNTLKLAEEKDLSVKQQVITWGYPLSYNGPSPILSVGYIAGFKEYERSGRSNKHLIVNGAINQGNSGGPLFRFDDNKVIGIVVNKHLPFTKFQLSAMEALANNPSGIQYAAVNDKGENVKFSESQLVVDLLEHFKSLSQVMIGEAIDVSELIGFLDECKLNQ